VVGFTKIELSEMANDFELRGKRVLVVGRQDGRCYGPVCAERGATVTATDARNETEIGEAIASCAIQKSCSFGAQNEKFFYGAGFNCAEPGVPADLPDCRWRVPRGLPLE